ncbi:maleylacetate reductase [Bosea sp. NPDC055332]
MQPFVYEALPARVLFGHGTVLRLGEEVERLGLERVLVLSTPGHRGMAERTAATLGTRAAGVFAEAVMHTPVEVTERAMAEVAALAVDGVVAIGGGSTIGLGKAIALRSDLPQVVIPMTYAGSEMTPILGETRDGLKTTQRNPRILPKTVIYDVDLTLSLPPQLSATSGINAIAHAVEALYAADGNPIVSLMAEEGIAALARVLPAIARDPSGREARSDALYGAWLCGTCLGAVGMALHHKLCHVLGGTFDLPHAETHTVILPHGIAYNAASAPGAMRRIARALGANEAAAGAYDLARRLGAPQALRDLGMPESGIEQAVEIATRNPYPNPRPVERDAIRGLIARAWAGEPPQG